ncbi:hypothetical protein KY290_007039 [Solanum tuberosum]|uniref:2-oxoglutarate/malate translocator n=1 Tax=Solanum tuberosum TaxID=4113 RepID=A0ABQ7W4C3_SOLTU|nr:hypothetical protein KY290_007039 [Solanum tuberosum]
MSTPKSPLPTHNSTPSSPNHSPPPPPPSRPRRLPPWKGAKLIPLAISIAIGLIFRFAVPKPHKVTTNAWQLLAIFLATISGLVLGPLPVGAWAFLCLTVTVVTKTLTFAAAFAAFTNEVICCDNYLMDYQHGLWCTGGSVSPLTRGLGFEPWSKKRLSGAISSYYVWGLRKGWTTYAALPCISCSSSSSALFLTAAAQNLLCVKLAEGLGVQVSSKWLTWLKASCIPAVISLLVTPVVLYKIFPPEMKDTPDAPLMARRRLQQMGPMKSDEWVMTIVMLVTVGLWIAGEAIGLASVITAMLGLALLLTFGILDWNDCLSEKSAWDTLAWFGVLIGMASQLTTLGVVAWMSNAVGNYLESLSLHWFGAFCILQAAYFFIHYLFASQTGHVAALYSAFLAMCLAAKVPGLFAALALGYNTNLFGGLTHYSSGQAAVYYGAGYVELRDVFKLGIIIAIMNIVIWAVAGAGWWKVLGLY